MSAPNGATTSTDGWPQPYVTPVGAAQSSTGFSGRPAPAAFQVPGGRVYGGFRLGVGGEAEPEYDDSFYQAPKKDLKPAFGLQAGAGYVWRYFGIGGEMRINWVGIEGFDDRLKLLDLVVKPRGGYRFRELPLEVYGALPLGVSIPLNDLVLEDEYGDSATIKLDPGFTIGFVVGATYFLTPNLGLNAEMGWLAHLVKFTDYEGDKGTLSAGQWNLLSANLVYAIGSH